MSEEFNLSKKFQFGEEFACGERFYLEEDVKEFIRRLKKECDSYVKAEDVKISIDKLAGEELKDE